MKELFKKLNTADEDTVSHTTAEEQNINIMRCISGWKRSQIIHMPALSESDVWEGMPKKEDGVVNCWNINLQFPSSFGSEYL